MTPEDRFWITFGKFVALCSFGIVFCMALLFVALAITAERDYRTDTTPLMAPDSTKRPK